MCGNGGATETHELLAEAPRSKRRLPLAGAKTNVAFPEVLLRATGVPSRLPEAPPIPDPELRIATVAPVRFEAAPGASGRPAWALLLGLAD